MKKYKHYLIWGMLFLLVISSTYFVFHNHPFYEKTIGEVIEVNTISKEPTIDQFENKDELTTQLVALQIKNGTNIGKRVEVENVYSISQASDYRYRVGDDLFLSLKTGENQSLEATIDGVKRDQYLVIMVWMLILMLFLVGKKQGFYSLITLMINAVILSYALNLYIAKSHLSLLVICSICIVLFTIISLFIVNGINKKTAAAIISTFIGTIISLFITVIVLKLTNEQGLHFEELQFLTRPYKTVFMAGLFLGALGAVMDVSITMSSSLVALYEENPTISMNALIKSGLAIGKDIMGTMTNILFFAYVSGSIPMLVLYFKNAGMFGYTLSINLSLEIVRALAGGIGIVITIPVGLYVTLLFINKSKKKVA